MTHSLSVNHKVNSEACYMFRLQLEINSNSASLINKLSLLLMSSQYGANRRCSVIFKLCLEFVAEARSRTISIITFLDSAYFPQYSKKCSTDSSACPHSHNGVSEVPVRWLSFLSMVSCSTIRQYAIPMSLNLENAQLRSNFAPYMQYQRTTTTMSTQFLSRLGVIPLQIVVQFFIATMFTTIAILP